MLDVIHKADYFRWYEKNYVDKRAHHLKAIQDAWVLSELHGSRNLRIAEIGGGDSRVLEHLKKHNEVWNVDKFEGVGNGPTKMQRSPGIRYAPVYLGDFDPSLPDGYFDIVFSISVVEHIGDDALPNLFKDASRILKPGGRLLHAIDIYVYDKPRNLRRVALYRDVPRQHTPQLRWEATPAIDENLSFSCAYASNSDLQLASWNRVAPRLRQTREVTQNVSIKAAWRKDAGDAPVTSVAATRAAPGVPPCDRQTPAAEVAPLDRPADWKPLAVAVHQVGKVGSKSVDRSLRALKRFKVYQTHVLNPSSRYLSNPDGPPPQGYPHMPPHIRRAAEFREKFLLPHAPVAVVTLVREPVSRNLSAFFQNIGRHPEVDPLAPEPDIDRFIDVFLNDYEHDEPIRWFDQQVNEPFGVDVFEFPFDHDLKYLSLRQGDRRLLILRVEEDDGFKAATIGRFLGIRDFSLQNENLGETKPYADAYRRFRNRVRLPASYLDRMLESRFARHFYTAAERDAVRARWIAADPASRST
jgi:SAM-dependent methyltransferase